MINWTDELTTFISEMYAKGEHGSTIATELFDKFGVTASRCAVHGKLARLGLQSVHGQYSGIGRRAGARRKQTPKASKPPRKGKSRPTPPKLHLVYSAPDVSAPKGSEVRFIDRVFRQQCSHIAGDPKSPEVMCCGAPIPEGARLEFCDFHLRMAFAPDTRKPKREVVREEAA